MDPNTTLENLRVLYIEFKDTTSGTYEGDANALDFMEAFANLDDWLTKGGLLPREWERR